MAQGSTGKELKAGDFVHFFLEEFPESLEHTIRKGKHPKEHRRRHVRHEETGAVEGSEFIEERPENRQIDRNLKRKREEQDSEQEEMRSSADMTKPPPPQREYNTRSKK